MKPLVRFKSLALLIAVWAVFPVAIATAGDRVYFFHNDHLGAPQAMTDLAGRKVWEAEYEPFGKATVNEDPDGDGQIVVNNLRFPGQYYDAETGLHYNYHRDYDPATGRYLQPDPIGLIGGLNLYSYVLNNPINEIDPFGLWPKYIHDALIEAAFPNLSTGLKQSLKDASAEVDSPYPGQLNKNSHTHAMSQDGESPLLAALKWTKYLNDQQDMARRALHTGKILCGQPGAVIVPDLEKAFYEFGKGLHALSDSTPPSHRGFQPWEVEHFRSHHNAEKSISPANFQTTVDLMRQYYKTTFGTNSW